MSELLHKTELQWHSVAADDTCSAVQCLSQEVFLSLHEDPVFKRSNPSSYLRQRTWRGTEDFVEGHRDLTGRRGRARRSLSRAPFWRLRTTQNLLEAKTSLSESNNASQLSRADDSLDDVRMNRTTLFLISIGTPLLCTVETTAARDLSSTPQFSSFSEAPRSFCERSYLREELCQG